HCFSFFPEAVAYNCVKLHRYGRQDVYCRPTEFHSCPPLLLPYSPGGLTVNLALRGPQSLPHFFNTKNKGNSLCLYSPLLRLQENLILVERQFIKPLRKVRSPPS